MSIYRKVPSAIGTLTIISRDQGRSLSGLYTSGHRLPKLGQETSCELDMVVTQLDQYFDGDLQSFDLPLDMAGNSFEQEVWAELRNIPYAITRSYGELAGLIGRDRAASRAVGTANARNPISIIVPCHRVIGADGSLTGYAGGLEIKRWLLDHEAQHATHGQARQVSLGL